MMTSSTTTMSMGPAFSQWAHLTTEYQKGLEALHRGDTSGAKHMMRLAREIQMLGLCCSDPLPIAEPAEWCVSEMEALSPPKAWPSVGQRFARIFATMRA